MLHKTFELKKKGRTIYKKKNYQLVILFEPLVGFEPTTPRLQITCSGQLS